MNKSITKHTKTMLGALALALGICANPIAHADQIDVAGPLLGTNTWHATNTYTMQSAVYVLSNAVLNIEPGTVIYGTPSDATDTNNVLFSALIVCQGGKVYANGTSNNPIIFTAEGDDVNDPTDFLVTDVGQWGGIVLLGNASINTSATVAGNTNSPKYDVYEGAPDVTQSGQYVHRYGGGDDADSSGELRYVSIRHGGAILKPNKEINGLSLCGVGSGTVVEHIEVYANSDDGFEWFGGTVNAKYLVSAYCEDEEFDIDQGYRGKGQFWFGIHPQNLTGQFGGEWNGEPNTLVATNAPMGKWTIYNMTLIGSQNADKALRIRDLAAPNVYNAVFTSFTGGGMQVDNPFTNNFANGNSVFKETLWNTNTGPSSAIASNLVFNVGSLSNVFANPLLTGVSYTTNRVLDPRPQTGSPALYSTEIAPNDGFYTPVTFKGAFNGSELWMRGWTALDSLGFLSTNNPVTSNNIDVAGPLVGTNTWYAANTYTMQSAVYVLSNAVLNIEPGTVIYGTPSDATDTNNVLFSALIVCQGGKVYANGTSNNPIIFTAEGDDVNDPTDFLVTDVGQWGGIVLLGNASINTSATVAGNTNSPKYDVYEGAPDVTQSGQYVHRYGGGDDADSSGELRYVSIRHGGAILKPNKEINGLSLCGVGSGTVVEHIEVYANSDDGFEWFGGTVNAKYLVSAYCEDEEFDIDQGYRGKGQFWFGIHPQNLTGQFGGEWNGEPNTLVATNAPMGKWTIYNMTLIGSQNADKALRIRDLAAPNVYNAVFTSFTGGGMQVDNPFTNNFANGNSVFKETLWNTNTGPSSAIASNLVFSPVALHNTFANPLLTGVSYTTNRVLDPRPQTGSPALYSTEIAPNDGFYTPVTFKGAFNGSELWMRGWTAFNSLGFLSTNNPVTSNNIDVAGPLVGTNTWYAANTYTMQSAVYVLSNAVLNIEPGTVIYGTPSDATDTNNVLFSALIVCQGGKVYANGTSNNPIIFTAEGDDVNDPTDFLVTDVGQWGGIVLLGNASINTSATVAGNTNSPKYDVYEGAPDVTQSGQYVHRYGGGDDADSSGELRYVSIRHGGAILKPNKEINGLSLCGVGSGTVVEHIEVYANSDDGFEWFGGTVNAKYLVSAYCEDEEFDIDQGYRGKGQFWFGIHPQNLTGQFGGEWNGEPNTLVATNAPMGKWTIYNMTLIGSQNADKALRIRDLAAPNVYNAVFTSFTGGGMQVDNPFTNNFANGNSVFKETLWNTNTGPSSAIASNLVFSPVALHNTFANPLLTGVSYTTNRVLDPRPQTGSPALYSTEIAPNDGFYTPVTFKGAFNGSELWMRGWTALDSLGFLSTNNPVTSNNIDVAGPLVGTNTWYAANTYTMQSAVYVLSNAVLNIEPGTVIYGTPSDATDTNNVLFSALIVCQGGKVYANGTSNNPIIFTAEGDDVNDPTDFLVTDVGQWGGIVLLGNASINTSATVAGNTNSPKYDVYEGAPDVTQSGQYVHRYGGGDDADSSGELRYVSIRHGGAILKPNKEINGLSLCGVGSGTVVEHIEVYANSDDGFEWFGGTVNAKYLVSAYCEDEEFDIDQGYRGKGQFWFGIHPQNLTGQFGGEWNGEPNTLVATNAPMGKWTIYNMTLIGSQNADKALRIRDLAAPNVYNAVFTSFTGGGMQVDNPFTNNFANGNSVFKETLWNTNTGPSSAIASNLVFNVGSLSNVFANPLLTGVSYTTNRVLDPRPQTGSPALGSSETAPNDGFYTPVAFKGAFNGSELWMRGWTALDSLGFLSTNNPVVVVPPAQPTITAVAGVGTLTFSINSQSGYSYELQATLVLNPPAWSNLVTLPGNGGVLSFPPVATTNAMEYFRIFAQ